LRGAQRTAVDADVVDDAGEVLTGARALGIVGEVKGLGGGGGPGGAGSGEAAFEEAVDIELAARGINDKDDVMPLIVVVAGEVEGAAAAPVHRARQIAQVPGAEVAVIQEHLIAVEGVGDVFVHDAVDAAGGRGLDPDGDGQGVGIESGGAGDRDIAGESVESQGEVELTGGPSGAVHQGCGIATAQGIGGRQAGALVELPVPHESRVDGRAIGDRDTDGGGGAEVAGGVAGHGGQGVRAVDGGRRIPGGGVGGRGDLGAEVDAIKFELDADDAHVVGGAGGDRECAGEGGSGGRGHDGSRRRRDVSQRGGDGGRGAQGDGAGAGAGAAAAGPAGEGGACGGRGSEGDSGAAREAGGAGGPAVDACRGAGGGAAAGARCSE